MRTLALLSPEALVAIAALACLLASRIPLLRAGWLPIAAAGAVALALGIELTAGAQVTTLFHGGYSQDRFALFAKAALLLATFLVVLGADWLELSRSALGLTLLACTGGMVAASATDLVGVWAGLELAVLASVGAAGLHDRLAGRRALLFGAALGALVAIGMAMLAATSGTFVLSAIRHSLTPPLSLPLALAMLLVLGALLAQLAAAPSFGPLAVGATGIALFKVAGAAAGLAPAWSVLIPAAAAAAMLVAAIGSVGGSRQSGVAGWAGLLQLGWVIAGLAAGERLGITASVFLFGAYLVASAAAPVVLGNPLHGLSGLAHRSVGRALGYTACLLSLACVPPLAGFLGAFAISAVLVGSGLFWLVTVGFFATAVVSFAVLRDLRLVYLAPSSEQVGKNPVKRVAAGAAVLTGLAMVGYAVLANPISGLAAQGASAVGLR